MKFEDLVLGSDYKNIYFLINKDYIQENIYKHGQILFNFNKEQKDEFYNLY